MDIINGIKFKDIRDIVLNAGNILLKGFYKDDKNIKTKSDRELVTKYDLLSEEFLKGELKKFGFDIIAEESENPDLSTEYWWVIDPLDGTNNFSFSIPHFCVTVALMKNEEVIFGIIYDPVKKEIYHSIKGNKAYLNDKLITVSTRKQLEKSMLATGFAYDRDKKGYNNLNNFNKITLKAKGIRRMGSAALDLAYVAAGRYDGFWERGLKLWDMAAGKLIVEESKGKTTDINGNKWALEKDNILATNRLIHKSVIKNLDRYDDSF